MEREYAHHWQYILTKKMYAIVFRICYAIFIMQMFYVTSKIDNRPKCVQPLLFPSLTTSSWLLSKLAREKLKFSHWSTKKKDTEELNVVKKNCTAVKSGKRTNESVRTIFYSYLDHFVFNVAELVHKYLH